MTPNKMANEPHIVVRNLSKHYRLGETTVKALDEVSLTIAKSEFIIIMGPSGSGKSTLVNMIGGVDTPSSGDVVVSNYNLANYSQAKLTKYRRKSLGFVFQFYSLVPTLTAQENVELAAELVGVKGKELRKRSMEVLGTVGLKGREKSYPSMLSGGERQRVALARAIAKYPELIIVDEPTGQLDEETGRNMVELIRDVSKKYRSTVIMVTHDQSLIDLADRVFTMSSGKIEELQN